MKIVTSALLVLALSGPALAQPGSTPAAGDWHRANPGSMSMMAAMNCPMMAGHSEGVLAFLKTELKVTPAQSAAWEAFAKSYRDSAASLPQMSKTRGGQMGSGPGSMMGDEGQASMPLPDRMNSHLQMMEARLAAMQKMQAAVRPLYETLSAEQRKTADRLLPMFAMMGGMM